MGQIKKLRRFGSRTYGVTLGVDLLQLLGTSIEAAESEEGVDVDVTIYGDTLIVRLAGTPKPSPAELAYFVSEDFDYANYFPSSAPEDEFTPRLNVNTLFKPEKAVPLTKTMRSIVRALAELGPLTSAELVEQASIDVKVASRGLRSGFEDGLFTKDGGVYRLNPEVFDVKAST